MKDWIGLVARLVPGVTFLIAGLKKLPDPAGSVRAVRAYEILPESVVPSIGYLLPALEVVVGLLLVLGLLTRLSALLSALLMVAFIIGIVWAWSHDLSIDCGCFGGGGYKADASDQYPWDIARDAGLLALSAWLVVRPRSRWSLDSVLFRSSTPDDSTDSDERTDDVEEHA